MNYYIILSIHFHPLKKLKISLSLFHNQIEENVETYSLIHLYVKVNGNTTTLLAINSPLFVKCK